MEKVSSSSSQLTALPTDFTFADFVSATASRELVAVDVCDRCGARAYVLVTLENGGELLYCAHHFGDVKADKVEQLKKSGATINDQRHRLDDEVKQTEA